MGPLIRVGHARLMGLGLGRPDTVLIGLMDGPVVMDHPDLTAKGGALSLIGTGVAMASVTEGIDLLWSASPDARATEVKFAAASILRITKHESFSASELIRWRIKLWQRIAG
jgi:hypothetical protein